MMLKITSDGKRSESLRKMAETTLKRLNKTDKRAYPANTLTDYYDIIHKLMEAFAAIKGVKFRGEGAHQELIDFTSKELVFSEHDREFLQQMRSYRNRIHYEGFEVHANFIFLNEKRIRVLIRVLLKHLSPKTT
ncbi:MAG: hypothetical protein KJ709_04295 [Nanoarchaeota archaeon]|nr:hypothetical protein [Nanoarchaeota archaeon]